MKVVLILLVFMNGEPAGQFNPSLKFETMEQCVAAYKDDIKPVLPVLEDGGKVRGYCVSESEVRAL